MKRADTLFQAHRWSDARASYDRARHGAQGAERDRTVLRMAACDVQLRRYRQAAEPLKGQMAGAYSDEATFFYLLAVRGLGDRGEYEREARQFADSHRDSPYAEDTLNNLASHFIVADEDTEAEAGVPRTDRALPFGSLHRTCVLARRLVGLP